MADSGAIGPHGTRFVEVAKRFGAREVFSGVSFSLTGPRIVGLIGDNGAGKTTLLRLALGLYRPTSGSVFLFDGPADRNNTGVMRRVGALIEKPGHYDELSVRDNLSFFYSFYCNSDTLAGTTEAALRRFGLREVATEPAGRLSSGYRQRLALARAVHPWADIVLLDEPFESLDPRSRASVKTALRDMRAAGKLVVFSSHGLADVQQICDEILLLAAGRLFRFRDFEDVRAQIGGIDAADDLDALYARLTERLSAKGMKGRCEKLG